MIVYVLNKHNKPLMPCSSRKARILLRDKKAKVVDVEPLTIQLLYGSRGYKQPITLGMDTGFEKVGISAVSGKKEIYRSEVELRTDISKKLTTRRMFRRARRGRKTRYRKPRFLNRGNKGWLPPSVQHKVDSHVRLVERVRKILPISRTVVEKAKFDIARINNPELEGKDFQEGSQYGYANVRTYVKTRDGTKCRHCGDKEETLEVHHIIHRDKGGTDRPDNLATLCRPCHKKHHRGEIGLKLGKPPVQKQMTVMNIISKRLTHIYEHTFGYMSKMRRLEHGLEKSHVNDAFVIAGGTADTKRLDYTIVQKQVRRNNRKLHKGHRSEISNQCPKEVFGFRLFDKVIYEGKKFFVWGRRKKGLFLIKTLEGDKLERSYWKLRKYKGQNSFLTELQFPSGLKAEVPLE